MVVYAVIMQYHEMAYLFWKRCTEPIGRLPWLPWGMVTVVTVGLNFNRVYLGYRDYLTGGPAATHVTTVLR